MTDPLTCLQIWTCSVASYFGHLQDNIRVWELKVSVQLMHSWTSRSVLPGCGLSAVAIISVENQVNIKIFQFCCHITLHTIYECLKCAISRPVYGPKHSWAINDCDIWLACIWTWRDFFSVDLDLDSLMCPVGSNINGGYADNSLASMTLKSRDLLLINNPITSA